MHAIKHSAAFTYAAACAPLAFMLAGCASTADHKSTGEVIDDSVITAKVKAKLVDDFALKGLQIQVDTNRGVVQLSGYVTTQTSIAQATADANAVEGVISVQNNIQLK